MDKKRAIGFTVITIILFSMITYFKMNGTNLSESSPQSEATATPEISKIITSASWESNAEAVKDLIKESNLVVRARVSGEPITRVFSQEIPIWDENGNIVDTRVYEALFSDTLFEIIKVYWGESPINLLIMQTGGVNPEMPNIVEEVKDDPLYNLGEEYILFLVDISGDPAQAPDRELYRIVNPFGRYKVDSGNAYSYGHNQQFDAPLVLMDIRELESQIEEAIQELNK